MESVRWVVLLLVSGSMLHAGVASADEEDAVRRLLASPEATQVAWGAWRAAEGKHVSERAHVLRRLEASLDPAAGLAQAFPYLLDAAIRLEALPSPALTRAIIGIAPTATTVWVCAAAAKRPEAVRIAFGAMDRRSREWGVGSPRWVALGNVLAAQRARDFAGLVATGLAFRRRLRVYEGPKASPWRAPTGRVHGDGGVRRRAGFPPLPRYVLSFDPEGRVLSDGQQTVYVQRHVHEDPVSYFATTAGPWVHPTTTRLAWLRTLAGERVLPPLRTFAVWYERYAGDPPLRRAVAKRVLEIRERAYAWCAVLIKAGLMTTAEAAAVELPIELVVDDVRKDKRRPLPELRVVPASNPFRTKAWPRVSY